MVGKMTEQQQQDAAVNEELFKMALTYAYPVLIPPMRVYSDDAKGFLMHEVGQA